MSSDSVGNLCQQCGLQLTSIVGQHQRLGHVIGHLHDDAVGVQLHIQRNLGILRCHTKNLLSACFGGCSVGGCGCIRLALILGAAAACQTAGCHSERKCKTSLISFSFVPLLLVILRFIFRNFISQNQAACMFSVQELSFLLYLLYFALSTFFAYFVYSYTLLSDILAFLPISGYKYG